MSLTVALVRARLSPRIGPLVGLADLNEATAYSLALLGITPASAAAVADSDLARVTSNLFPQLEDVIVCRAWETILMNLTDAMLREVGCDEKASDLRPVYERRLAMMEDRIRVQYGVGLSVPSAGVISMDFQAKGDDTFDGM